MTAWYEPRPRVRPPRQRAAVTIHRRLVALARDAEIPRVCRWALLAGLAIPGPLDEVVIYPAVVAFVWFRRRHVLERHGFRGVHVVGAVAAGLVASVALGFVFDVGMRAAGL